MNIIRIYSIFICLLALILPAPAQNFITTAQGFRHEFVCNIIAASTTDERDQPSQTLTGLAVSPIGDIYVGKPGQPGDERRMIHVVTHYEVGQNELQNIITDKIETFVTDSMFSVLTGPVGPVDVQGIAVDSGGTVYFADRAGGRVWSAVPDSDEDGLSNGLVVFSQFAELSGPSNIAFRQQNGFTQSLYVTATNAVGSARAVFALDPDENNDGISDGWDRFASFNVTVPPPAAPMGLAFELLGSGPSSRDLFVAHESVGLYRLDPDVNNDGETDGIRQISTTFRGSLAWQTTTAGGGGTDLFVVRALSGSNSDTVTRFTFRSNGTIDTFTDLATGFHAPIAIAAGLRGDIFVLERTTGNLYRVSASSSTAPNVIITPGIGLVYNMDSLSNYANSLLPGIARVYSTTYEEFVFGTSVIISANDRLTVLPGQRMVFPGGRRLEIRGGLEAQGLNLNGLDPATGGFLSDGYDVAIISLAGFQQETGIAGINFNSPSSMSTAAAPDYRFNAADVDAALSGRKKKLGVAFGYATLTGSQLAGGWEGILFNSPNQISRLTRFTVRYANRGITYQAPSVGTPDDYLVLQQGLIDSNHTGIYLSSVNPLIRQCLIQRNYILSSESGGIGGGSTAAPESGTGIYVSNSSIPLITRNIIRANEFNGIAVTTSSRPRLGRANDPYVFPHAQTTNDGLNNFVNNGFNAIFVNTSRAAISVQYAQFNYWGTQGLHPSIVNDFIDSRIFDYNDNSAYSQVDYGQLRQGPVDIGLPVNIYIPSAVGVEAWMRYR